MYAKGNSKEYILRNERDLPWNRAKIGERFSLKLSYILGKDIKSLDNKTSFVLNKFVVIKPGYSSSWGDNMGYQDPSRGCRYSVHSCGYKYEVNIPSNGKYIVCVKTEKRTCSGKECYGYWDGGGGIYEKSLDFWEGTGEWVRSRVVQLTRGKHMWSMGGMFGDGQNETPWSQIIVTDNLNYIYKQ